MFTDLFIDRIVGAILEFVSWLVPDYENLFNGGPSELWEQLKAPPPSPTTMVWVQEQLSLIWGLLVVEYIVIVAAHSLWLLIMGIQVAFGRGNISLSRWIRSLTWSTVIVGAGVPALVGISKGLPFLIYQFNSFLFALGTYAPGNQSLQMMTLDSGATGISFGSGLNIIVNILAVAARFNLLLLGVLVTVGLLLSALSLATVNIGGVGKVFAVQGIRVWTIGLLGTSAMLIVKLASNWITALLDVANTPAFFIGALIIILWLVLIASPWVLGMLYNKYLHKLVVDTIDTSSMYNQDLNTDEITPGRMGQEKEPATRKLPADEVESPVEWPTQEPSSTQADAGDVDADVNADAGADVDVDVRADAGDTDSGETDSQQVDDRPPLRGNAPGTTKRRVQGAAANAVAIEADSQARAGVARAASGDAVEGAVTAAVALGIERTARNQAEKIEGRQTAAEQHRQDAYREPPTDNSEEDQ